LALLTIPACYATETVAIKDFRALGASLTDTRALQTPRGHYALLDAQTLVRAGDLSWRTAGCLSVSTKALTFEKGIPGESISRITVSGLLPEDVQRLTELAPAQGSVEPDHGESRDTYVLRSSQQGDILPWATRFVARQQQAGRQAGTWDLEISQGSRSWLKPSGQHSFFVPASELAEPLSASDRVVFATGERWPEIASLDLYFLSPVVSALAIPLFPVALLGANREDGRMKQGGCVEKGASKLMFRSPQETPEPLFTLNGQRRAVIKLVAGADGGLTYHGDAFASGTIGMRLLNFYELAFLARGLSLPGLASTDGRRNALLLGVAAGLHIDGDGDPRFAFYAGFEGAASSQPNRASMVSLILGPRFGLGKRLFLGVVPLGVTSVCAEGTSCSTRLFSSVQLGGSL
jgi:hypothetical protein